MPEVSFEFDIGDIVMVKPMAGSNVSYDTEIRNYQGSITIDQYRITQRRYVEDISGAGYVAYTGQVVSSLDKKVTMTESAIIKVDDYLAKKAILDSNRPKPKTANITRGAQITQGVNTVGALLPGIQAQYNALYDNVLLNSETNNPNTFAAPPLQ